MNRPPEHWLETLRNFALEPASTRSCVGAAVAAGSQLAFHLTRMKPGSQVVGDDLPVRVVRQ
jgi:hypothetical protein